MKDTVLTDGELKLLSAKIIIQALIKWDDKNNEGLMTGILGLRNKDLLGKVYENLILNGSSISNNIKENVLK